MNHSLIFRLYQRSHHKDVQNVESGNYLREINLI